MSKESNLKVEEPKTEAQETEPSSVVEVATADDIENATDVETELHHIPEFKKSVYIRALDTDQLDLLAELLEEAKEKGIKFNSMMWLACEFMVDKNGKKLMSFHRMKSKKRATKGLKRVVEIGMHLSGMSQEFRDSIKESLKSDPLDGSSSKSPSKLESLLA